MITYEKNMTFFGRKSTQIDFLPNFIYNNYRSIITGDDMFYNSSDELLPREGLNDVDCQVNFPHFYT